MKLIRVLLALLLAVSGSLIATTPAKATELNAIGGSVTWDASTFYQPTGCSNFNFNYVNGTGIRLLEFGMTITSKFGDKVADKSVIGMPAGITGSWSVQICSFQLTDGVGPYTVVLSVEDYQGSVRTAQGQLSFISRSGSTTTMAPAPTTNTVTPSQSSAVEVIGGQVTWDASTFYQPTGCSNFNFSYVNGTGIRLLQFGMTITSKFGDKLADKSVIGMPAGITGSWSVQICSFEFTDGAGPYTVTLSVEDYEGSVRTAQGQITFLSRTATVTPKPTVIAPIVVAPTNGSTTVNTTQALALKALKIYVKPKKVSLAWPANFDSKGIQTNYQVRVSAKNSSTFGPWKSTFYNTIYEIKNLAKGGRYLVEVRPLSNDGPGAAKRVAFKAK